MYARHAGSRQTTRLSLMFLYVYLVYRTITHAGEIVPVGNDPKKDIFFSRLQYATGPKMKKILLFG